MEPFDVEHIPELNPPVVSAYQQYTYYFRCGNLNVPSYNSNMLMFAVLSGHFLPF